MSQHGYIYGDLNYKDDVDLNKTVPTHIYIDLCGTQQQQDREWVNNDLGWCEDAFRGLDPIVYFVRLFGQIKAVQ
jgi:hypothetical protein